MRAWIPAAVGLLLLNAVLLRIYSRASAEREELERARTEIVELSEKNREALEHSRRVAALLERAAQVLPDEPLDVAALRDLLLDAERGLELRRRSLDFRAPQGSPAGAPRSVQASLSGSFSEIYRYLNRLEGLRWPLVLEEVVIRPAFGEGRLVLDLRSKASFDPGEGDEELSPAEVDRLEAWLSRTTDERPVGDLFAEAPEREMPTAPAPLQSPRSPAAPEAQDPPDREWAPARETPQLTGFVLARPELESDVSRRVLAAIRFGGELRLVKVGDVVGGFRVDRIDARESVFLVHEATGERMTLWLE